MQDNKFFFIQNIYLLRYVNLCEVFELLVSATWLLPALKAQKHQSCL